MIVVDIDSMDVSLDIRKHLVKYITKLFPYFLYQKDNELSWNTKVSISGP